MIRITGVVHDEHELEKLLELTEVIRAKIEHERKLCLIKPEKMADMA